MPSTKPTLLHVPGSFAPVSYYDNLLGPIRAAGIEFHVIPLQTVGRKEALPTMYDDAEYIAAEVRKHVDQGKDVVLIAHSYGGVPISQSTKGLTKKEREAEGKKGGIVRLAYMTAVVPELGQTSADALEGNNLEHVKVGEDGWMTINLDGMDQILRVIFNHLPTEEGVTRAKQFSQHSGPSFANKLTHAGYKDAPVSYLFCEDDKCVSPEHQQKFIETIEKASGMKVDVTKGMYDHCPSLSHTKETLEWIIGLTDK